MYSRYAESRGWELETLDSSPSDLGGFKEIIFNVSGQDVFKRLKYESGVHRVQRVPATEAQGRVHTSTATVAVLPEAEEVDVQLKPEELEITVCRASGPGGQGVNTTDSAVQILHKPSGLIVRCADGRSQQKNKQQAFTVLRSRLLEQRIAEENAKARNHDQGNHLRLRRHAGRHHAAALARLAGDCSTAPAAVPAGTFLRPRRRADPRHPENAQPRAGRADRSRLRRSRKGG